MHYSESMYYSVADYILCFSETEMSHQPLNIVILNTLFIIDFSILDTSQRYHTVKHNIWLNN